MPLQPVLCWEFWLNRYQTLISAGATIIAALIAAGLVRAQIIRASEQNKLTEKAMAIYRYDIVVQRYRELQAIRIDKVDTQTATDLVEDLEYFSSFEEIRRQEATPADIRSELEKLRKLLKPIVVEFNGGPAVVATADDFRRAMRRIQIMIQRATRETEKAAVMETNNEERTISSVLQAILGTKKLPEFENEFRTAVLEERQAVKSLLEELDEAVRG